MHFFLTKGLAETHSLWADVEMGYRWVHRAAHLLTNDEKQTAAQVRQNYETLLAEMEQAPTTAETVTTMLTAFRKVTASYWPGLFHCYNHADLPRTNNDLEQYFGSARYHERRATGRKSSFTRSRRSWSGACRCRRCHSSSSISRGGSPTHRRRAVVRLTRRTGHVGNNHEKKSVSVLMVVPHRH